ncbi:MAG: FkbM family methyltransferase [Silicimonas sp.]|nr:FkbM family methyltransferase [Silicimonas sp.]
MSGVLEMIEQKLFRAREALHLIFRHAADSATRRELLHIYSSLGNRSAYNDEVNLRMRFGKLVMPCTMRLSDIFILGEILFEDQYKLKSRIPEGATIIDAGGNVGFSSMLFLGEYQPSQVHVFEPSEDSFRLLSKNLGSAAGVVLNKSAVGRTSGQSTLHHGEFAGMHSLLQAHGMDGGEIVDVLSLADYMENCGLTRIDLLKLDIEGAELDALIGLGDRIADVSVIVGEVHEAMVDSDAIYEHLASNSFDIVWKKYFQEGPVSQVHNFEARRRGRG